MTGKGSAELARHNAGMRLSASKAILAKCCDCQKNYVTGKTDCERDECPLHDWMPYNLTTPRKKSEKKVEQGRKRFTKKEETTTKTTSKKSETKKITKRNKKRKLRIASQRKNLEISDI